LQISWFTSVQIATHHPLHFPIAADHGYLLFIYQSSCTGTFHILMRSSDAVEEHFGVLGCLLLLLKGLEITNGISLCSCVILHHYTYLCVLLMNFNILCSPLSVVFCHLFFSLQDGRYVDIIKIKTHASLSRLMDEYIERRGM